MRQLLLFFFALTSLSLRAENKKAPTPAPSRAPASKDVQYKKNTKLDFEGRSVDGSVVNPDSADVEGDKNIKFDSLVDGRKSFKREFKRSSGVSR